MTVIAVGFAGAPGFAITQLALAGPGCTDRG